MQDAVELISSGKVDLVVNTPRGSGPACRRRAHPPRRDPPPGPVHHHRRGRARGRGRRDRRVVDGGADGALAAGVPPRRPAPARGLRARDPATAAAGPGTRPAPRRAARRPAGAARAARAAEPDRRRVGHVRPRRRGRPAVPARPASVRSPRSPRPRSRGPGTRRRACTSTTGGMVNAVGLQGHGRRALGRRRPAGAAGARRARHRVGLGSRRSTTSRAPRSAARAAPRELVAVEVNVSCPNLHHGRRASGSPEARSSRTTPSRRLPCARSSTPTSGSRCSPSSRRTSRDLRRDRRRRARGRRRPASRSSTPCAGFLVDADGAPPDPRCRRRRWRALGRRDQADRAPGRARRHPRAPGRPDHRDRRRVAPASTRSRCSSPARPRSASGTATFLDPRATLRILDELVDWCVEHDVDRVADLTGALHAERRDRRRRATTRK